MKIIQIAASLCALAFLLGGALFVYDSWNDQDSGPDAAQSDEQPVTPENSSASDSPDDNEQAKSDAQAKDAASVQTAQTLAAMTEQQKEKYENIPDQDREEMIEMVSATQEASGAVSAGAQKYFELVEGDKKFEQIDADAEAAIAQLNSMAEAMPKNTDNPAASPAAAGP